MNVRTTLFLIFLCLPGTAKIIGQGYSLYSDEKLLIESGHLGESIELNLHLPETQPFSAATTKYPIVIIFDSQHDRTYPLIINSFDLLTSETQVPESIIIGVPFNMKNRLYFTSTQQREGDAVSGIKRMESFLFSELIPLIQEKYKGNEFISLIGHSRTAFLVNYLAFKRPAQVDLAISLSGFFNDEPLSHDVFKSFLSDASNFPEKFRYYYTAGTTLEESTYLSQLKNLDRALANGPIAENVKITLSETPHANHITNYWVSVPPILIDAFSAYNSVLDSWFHDKLNAENADISVRQFQADLEQAGKEIGLKLNPNLTHIYSLASHFAYSKEDYHTASDFIELGLNYFPDYLELYVELIGFYKALNDTKKVQAYKKVLREKTNSSVHLTESDKNELLQYLDED